MCIVNCLYLECYVIILHHSHVCWMDQNSLLTSKVSSEKQPTKEWKSNEFHFIFFRDNKDRNNRMTKIKHIKSFNKRSYNENRQHNSTNYTHIWHIDRYIELINNSKYMIVLIILQSNRYTYAKLRVEKKWNTKTKNKIGNNK